MSRKESIEAAKAQVQAYNDKDWEAVRKSVKTGFVYEEIATNRRLRGIDDVLEAWGGWAEALPDSEASFENAWVDGDTVVLELRWRGTHSGPLRTPGGDIPASGNRIDVPAVQVVELEDGRAAAVRHYFDMQTILSQIGATGAMATGAASPTGVAG
jgi:steroid delta-isomerase-like uncharacterized protein